MNNAAGLGKNLLVILNDNEMSICPRVGGLARYLDRARLSTFYQDSKRHLHNLLKMVPLVGDMANQAIDQMRDGIKATLTGGMLFEEFGFRYIGPIDGHDLPNLRRWLGYVKNQQGPTLLHVLTVKGHGVPQASEDPVTYHTPPVFEKVGPERTIVSFKRGGSKTYTDAASSAIYQAHAGQSPGRGHHSGHVPGQQAGKGPCRLPGPLFRHRHLRVTCRRLRRRPGKVGDAAHRGNLLHVLAACL